jgi:hypothetical protein
MLKHLFIGDFQLPCLTTGGSILWVFLRSSLKLILGVIKRVHWGVTPENYNRICARRCLTRVFERRMSQIAIFNPVHMALQGFLVSNAMFQRSTRPAICGVKYREVCAN